MWDAFDTAAAQQWVEAFERALAEVSFPHERQLSPISHRDADPRDKNANDSKNHSNLTYDGPPRLFITPNAQGRNKDESYIPTQNNIRLMRFERDIREWLSGRHWDTLGMYNMSVQSDSFDGTHATMESNLIKSMMVSL